MVLFGLLAFNSVYGRGLALYSSDVYFTTAIYRLKKICDGMRFPKRTIAVPSCVSSPWPLVGEGPLPVPAPSPLDPVTQRDLTWRPAPFPLPCPLRHSRPPRSPNSMPGLISRLCLNWKITVNINQVINMQIVQTVYTLRMRINECLNTCTRARTNSFIWSYIHTHTYCGCVWGVHVGVRLSVHLSINTYIYILTYVRTKSL